MVSRPQTHEKVMFMIQILNVLAPWATTKENPNIVLNYAYDEIAIFKKGSRPGKANANRRPKRQVPCTAIYSYIYIYIYRNPLRTPFKDLSEYIFNRV